MFGTAVDAPASAKQTAQHGHASPRVRRQICLGYLARATWPPWTPKASPVAPNNLVKEPARSRPGTATVLADVEAGGLFLVCCPRPLMWLPWCGDRQEIWRGTQPGTKDESRTRIEPALPAGRPSRRTGPRSGRKRDGPRPGHGRDALDQRRSKVPSYGRTMPVWPRGRGGGGRGSGFRIAATLWPESGRQERSDRKLWTQSKFSPDARPRRLCGQVFMIRDDATRLSGSEDRGAGWQERLFTRMSRFRPWLRLERSSSQAAEQLQGDQAAPKFEVLATNDLARRPSAPGHQRRPSCSCAPRQLTAWSHLNLFSPAVR